MLRIFNRWQTYCTSKSFSIFFAITLCALMSMLYIPLLSDITWKRSRKERPLIVAWTSFYKGTISATIHPTMDDCPYECDLVERSADNGRRIPSAYILHGRNLLVCDLPKRYSHQLMVLLLIEAPPNAGTFLTEIPKDYFNATITYRNDSNYPLPYGKFVRRKEDDDERLVITEEQIQNALRKKTKGALLLMSHCSTISSRESIIRRLSKKIKITVGGRCSANFPDAKEAFCPKSMKGTKCEKDLIAAHRFYIAFENSLCRNYITEKFFERISKLMIPVVLKRKFYEDNGIPPNSFIAVDDFKNDDDLAAYLDVVLHNDKEYLKYFEWTKNYRKPASYMSDAGCRLCRDLHQQKKLRVDNIETFYVKDQCEKDYS